MLNMQHKIHDILRPDFKVGVLGAGQLGKMLALAAANWHLPLHFFDAAEDFPAAGLGASFQKGDFAQYDDVLAFGLDKDVLTVEIEHVNTEALAELERRGVKVHPAPDKLALIKDKGLQKQFYLEKALPSSHFELFEDENAVKAAVANGKWAFPFVQKSRTAGYDGKGVSIIRSEADWGKLLPGSCLLEECVDIELELAVIVARNENGEIAAFPTVEMEFNPVANLVEFLVCPARISPEIEAAAQVLAKSCIEAYALCGLLAVELFLTKKGELLINEVAPRPHNSGHHTIDSAYTSQFEQHLRGILNLPLGDTRSKCPAVMVNLLGAEGHSGPTYYAGLAETLAIPGVNLHFYGKSHTKPYRKMGHATIVAETLEEAILNARRVMETLRIESRS
jgi:5-(carboxyamino)imidazole ribonucleotide synthase